jgi:hypothetical protein
LSLKPAGLKCPPLIPGKAMAALLLASLAVLSWGKPVIERAGGTHAVLTVPALPVRKLTDVGIIPAGMRNNVPYAGMPDRGFTNGYCTFTNVNVTNEYFLAFGYQPWILALYKADGTFVKFLVHPATGKGIGETADPRWDLSGRPGTEHDIYYHMWDGLFRLNALSGEQELIWKAPAEIASEDHADQSRDALYRCEGSSGTLWLVNLRAKSAHNTRLGKVYEYGVSPSGAWMYRDDPYDTKPLRFYHTGDIARTVDLPTPSQGHDGWAWDAAGREVYLYQDNKTDWFCAFDPQRRTLTRMLNLTETGYEVNQHFSRMPENCKGWFLLSTYGGKGWAANQLMLVQIGEKPRIVRLGHNGNLWPLPGVNDYFAQAFASIAPNGQAVLWGANSGGRENLEVYRMDLPAGLMQ